MIHKKDPTQAILFSRFDELLSDAAMRALNNSWHGIFRRTILALLPLEHIENKFSKTTGRPTKELYSVCGLLLLMEYFGWTQETARLNYMVDLGVQYALNIEQNREELSERTLFRYLNWLRKKDYMQETMNLVTAKLLEELKININEQRLDSTHVFSNMAAWSRKKLLHKIIQRFLKQVKRHSDQVYRELDHELVNRYENNSGWIFGETSPTKLNRGGKVFTTEEHMGYDMEKLIERFCSDPFFSNMTTYKDLVQVFEEQFVINDSKAELNPHPGGGILLNPSDRDAEIGHKGVGYQVQIVETCSEKNDVQLITAAIPQGASVSDMASLPEVLEKLKTEKNLPQELYADGGYGSDDNFVASANAGIELVAPAPPIPEDKVGLEECTFDEENKMISCPAGKKPMFKEFKNERGRAVFHLNVCQKCSLRDKCRSQKSGKSNREFRYSSGDLRSAKRRNYESTDEFKTKYSKKRIPIEGLNGRLKQFTPLRRLHIRGKPAVQHSILAILTMHNIMQAVRHAKIQLQKRISGAFAQFSLAQFSREQKKSFLSAA